ncbi:zinc finger protein 271 [Biomphalaria pfeifferi]|uniref:Zinc finger protein 271 n=1 Tax=Biomphalaria pfeifferi TaxID=112525 RepID=A0AAD8F5B2_BIOPF|nr:zinc finger protein 271 [Biomphalaria pfeifferi]
MDEYNLKQSLYKPDTPALTMSAMPVFASHPAMSSSAHFQNSSMPSAYNISMGGMYHHHHEQQHQHDVKHLSHQQESESRALNHNFVKPHISYSFEPSCPPFFNSEQTVHKSNFEDMLSPTPAFNLDSNSQMFSKLPYHPSLALNSQYSQEARSSYMYSLNKSENHEPQLGDREVLPLSQKVITTVESITSDMQVGFLTQNDMNNCNTIVTDSNMRIVQHQTYPLLKEFTSTSNDSLNIYKCGFCHHCVSDNDTLKDHLKKHRDLMPYCCGLCSASFYEGDELIAHVGNTHQAKAPYACGVCPLTFYKNEELLKHTESHKEILQNSVTVGIRDHSEMNSQPPFVGSKDDETVKDEDDDVEDDDQNENNEEILDTSELRNDSGANTIVISKDTKFSLRKGPSKIVMDDVDLNKDCTVIVEPSTAGGVRKKHLFKCNYCDKIFKDKGSLVSHVRTHTKGRPYECSTCHARFKQYAHLSDHVVTKHTKERPFVCDRCAKTFSRKSHLQDHIRLRHTEDKLYHCSECSATFEKRADFSDHRRTHSKPPKYQCSMCPRQFRNITDYERHIRSHTKEKRFECEVCHLTFGLLANAKKHMIKHSEDRPFKCETCPKAYHFEHDYKRHILTHLHKKPFPCSDCYKSFKNEALLKKHAKEAHLKLDENAEAKPFKCTTCRKRFRIQWDLDRHKKIHAKKKPFPCLYCFKTYGSEAMLTKHAKVHEGQNLPLYDHSKDIIETSNDENMPSKKKTKKTEDSNDDKSEINERLDMKDLSKQIVTISKRRGRPPKQKKESDSGSKKVPSIKITLKNKNPQSGKFQCPDCQKIFLTSARLKTHSKVHIKKCSKNTRIVEDGIYGVKKEDFNNDRKRSMLDEESTLDHTDADETSTS